MKRWKQFDPKQYVNILIQPLEYAIPALCPRPLKWSSHADDYDNVFLFLGTESHLCYVWVKLD